MNWWYQPIHAAASQETLLAISGSVTGTGVVAASLSATPAGGATSALAFWLGNVGAEQTGALTGAVVGTGVLSGAITVDANLSGSVVGTGVVSATGTFAASLVATTFGIGVVAAVIAPDLRMSGTVTGTGVVAATGTFDARLSAATVGLGVVAAGVTVDASLAAATSGLGVVAGALVGDANLVGTVTGTGVVAGALTADAHLSAATWGLGVVGASISGGGLVGSVFGSVFGTGIVSASIDASASLACTTAGTGALYCSLTADASLDGTATGTGNAAGALTVEAAMSGAAFGTGGVSGGVSGTTNVPEDPDVLTVTGRVDSDAATIRPIRPVFYHAADSALEADFTGFDRSYRIDRHYQRSSRLMRNPTVGNRFDVGFDAVRAGEAFALHRFVAWVSPEAARNRAAENTGRTDASGASVAVPSFFMLLSAATARDGAFSTLGATVQDRWVARFAVPSAQGHGARYEIDLVTDGRGGTAFAFDRIVCEVSATEARLRETDNTDRTDDAGATIGVQSFRFVVAADGAREADTETLDAFVTGRWNAAFAVPSAQGLGQFFDAELGSLGRAGHAFAIDRLVMMVSDAAEARPGDET